MLWKICYYNQIVENENRELPKKIRAKFEAILDMMLEYSPNLGLPHAKAMDNGIFEIRAKGQEGIARGFFCTLAKKQIVILHIFIKKTNATPKKELERAVKRMKEVKKYEI